MKRTSNPIALAAIISLSLGTTAIPANAGTISEFFKNSQKNIVSQAASRVKRSLSYNARPRSGFSGSAGNVTGTFTSVGQALSAIGRKQ